MKTHKGNIVHFLFEAATLKRLQRTGWQILGGGNHESIAEHSFMVSVISFILAKKLSADVQKVLVMSLFHDFTEARIGDVYKLADLYVTVDEKKAQRDAFSQLLETRELVTIADEYEEGKTLEARIVHDADTLALCIELKQLMEKGNSQAKEWFVANKDALRLQESKQLISELENTDSKDWWKKEREEIHKRFKKVS